MIVSIKYTKSYHLNDAVTAPPIDSTFPAWFNVLNVKKSEMIVFYTTFAYSKNVNIKPPIKMNQNAFLPLKNKKILSTNAIKLYGFINKIKFWTNPLTPKEKST